MQVKATMIHHFKRVKIAVTRFHKTSMAKIQNSTVDKYITKYIL